MNFSHLETAALDPAERTNHYRSFRSQMLNHPTNLLGYPFEIPDSRREMIEFAYQITLNKVNLTLRIICRLSGYLYLFPPLKPRLFGIGRSLLARL